MIEVVGGDEYALHELPGGVEPYPGNPKAPTAGEKYQRGLDAMLSHFGFVGSMSLTPRCTEELAPALAAAFGAHGKNIIGDGHLRREVLPRLGWKWVVVIPGPDSPKGDPRFLDRLAAIPLALRDRYRELVQAGQQVALGTVYPFLNTPEQLALFTLGHDGSRRSYDDGKKEKIREFLLGAGVQQKLVHDLAISSQATIRRLFDQQKEAERAAREREEQERKAAEERAAAEAHAAAREARAEDGGDDDGSPPRSPASAQVAQRREQRLAGQVVYTQPLRLKLDAFSELERLQGLVKSHALAPGREGRFLAVLERAARRLELGDAAVEVVVERVQAMGPQGQAETLSALLDVARKLRADDDVLMAAVVAAAREGLDAIEADRKRR